ncbi:MAG: PilZ domain-containing protein [Gallionella sp.]|nr:PilZ domain-containing protein [Gallionella sp.]
MSDENNPDVPKREESRSEPRIHVRWHLEAVDGQFVYHGSVKDISTKGADIFLDHNFQNVKLVTLRIHVPPLHVTDEHCVIEVSGKVIYSNHDSDEMLFRTGIKFLKFTVESDLENLRSRLAKH